MFKSVAAWPLKCVVNKTCKNFQGITYTHCEFRHINGKGKICLKYLQLRVDAYVRLPLYDVKSVVFK